MTSKTTNKTTGCKRYSIRLIAAGGKRAGIPDTGSFTIVWRHTDLGVNSDREEFTFNMNTQ